VITEDVCGGLNVALNESRLLSVQVDRAARSATVWCEVLTLPEDGPESADAVVVLRVRGVTRVAASLREGWWNDKDAAVTPVTLDRLDAVVRDFGGSAIYGWEFIDPPEESWADWRGRLSLDEVFSTDAAGHVLELFQEGTTVARHLDLRLWFADLGVTDRHGQSIELEHFVAGGMRWWDALYAGDSRTDGHGIVPGAPG
jgi:hypothetical protein